MPALHYLHVCSVFIVQFHFVKLVSIMMEMSESAYRAAVHPHPHEHARAASGSAPDAWWPTFRFRWSGIYGQAFPLPAEEFAGDSSSYNYNTSNLDYYASK